MSDPEQALQQRGDGAPPQQVSVEGVEDALLDGDLSKLSPQQRLDYYEKVCESVGLNPLTKPFEYIRLNGQLTLYATRAAAEQLRKVNGISITDLDENWRDSLCIFRAKAEDAEGRTDVATGAVDTSRSSGQDLANDIMKAETKAKRRVTLSLAGLGWLDETEVSDIPDQATEEVDVDYDTGEVKEDTYNLDGTPDTTVWEAPTGQSFNVDPNAAGELDKVHQNLADMEGADLAAMVEKCRQAYDWPGREGEVMGQLLDHHEQRLADEEDQQAEEAAADNDDPDPNDDLGIGEPTDPVAASEKKYEDATEALQANFDAAWADGKEGWESISEAQLNRLYAIADENDWDEAGLNRLVKDELGWDSKAGLPYGDPYDEVCEALQDERLRYHMHRDPDTPDMFEEDDDPNHEAFEDGAEDDGLPF